MSNNNRVNKVASSPRAVVNQPPIMKSTLDYKNEWSQGLCDCCTDCKQCCFAWWCPLCFIGILFTDAREFLLTPCNVTCSMAYLRAKIRSTYKIKGKLDGDGCTVCFCFFCSMLQMKHELISRMEVKD